MSLRIYEIDPEYILYLHGFDCRVSLEHNDGKTRKYLGILLEVDGKKYYAPMSSPKPKHLTINSSAADIYKIDDGNLGVVNLNNMIPVPNSAVIDIDINTIANFTYKRLLQKQARKIKADSDKIIKKANRLYKMVYRDTTSESLIKRCCDFKMLEEKSSDYAKELSIKAATESTEQVASTDE